MTIIGKEALQSRKLSRSGGRVRYERVFVVHEDDPANNPNSINDTIALDKSGVAVGNPHPENGAFFATDYISEQAKDSRTVWNVQWTYEAVGAGSGGDPFEVGFTEINTAHTVEFIDTYRIDPVEVEPAEWPPLVVPNLGNPLPIPKTNQQGADVSGMSIDEVGRPVSSIVRNVRFLVTHVVKGLLPIDLQRMTNFAGTRNSVAFLPLSAPAGVLLYKGGQSARIGDDTYRVVHEFVADELFHMRQIAQHGEDGKPILEDYSGLSVAAAVFWIQPFPRTLSFDDLGIPL